MKPDGLEVGGAPNARGVPADGLIRERATVGPAEEQAAAAATREAVLEQVLAQHAGDRDRASTGAALRRHATRFRIPAPLDPDHVGVEVDVLVDERLELAGPKACIHGRGPHRAVARGQRINEPRGLGG